MDIIWFLLGAFTVLLIGGGIVNEVVEIKRRKIEIEKEL